jgi:hypothetical protein
MAAPKYSASSTDSPAGSGCVVRFVRVLPCAGCGYPFDHELLGKYGCPNCEGEKQKMPPSKKFRKIRPTATKGNLPESP